MAINHCERCGRGIPTIVPPWEEAGGCCEGCGEMLCARCAGEWDSEGNCERCQSENESEAA